MKIFERTPCSRCKWKEVCEGLPARAAHRAFLGTLFTGSRVNKGAPDVWIKAGAYGPGASPHGQFLSFFHLIAVAQPDHASSPHLHSCEQTLPLLLHNEVCVLQKNWHLQNSDKHLKTIERGRRRDRWTNR